MRKKAKKQKLPETLDEFKNSVSRLTGKIKRKYNDDAFDYFIENGKVKPIKGFYKNYDFLSEDEQEFLGLKNKK